jgi:hypothetical protein
LHDLFQGPAFVNKYYGDAPQSKHTSAIELLAPDIEPRELANKYILEKAGCDKIL